MDSVSGRSFLVFFIVWIFFDVFSLIRNVKGSVFNYSNIPLHFSDYLKQLLVVQYVYSEGTLCDSKA